MVRSSAKQLLSAPQQRLLDAMQHLNFGRIEHLTIRDGQPVWQPAPRLVREIKFGGDNGPRPERELADYRLKSQLVELFQTLTQLDSATIEVLEIKHGLPFRMTVSEHG